MADPQPHRYKHPHPAVAVDLVIFTLLNGQLQLLLIERGIEPYRGAWALPGGFMRIDEDLVAAAQRELVEETGIGEAYLEQVGAFGQPKRDPRERVVSVAYFAILPAHKVALAAGSDAKAVAWHPYSELPELAFDHASIVAAAKAKLAEKVNRTTVALEFLPPEFTLTELQQVFETIRGETLDKRNFRKWAGTLSYIKATGRLRRGGQHRPAALFKPAVKGAMPIPTASLEWTTVATEKSSASEAAAKAQYRRGFEDAVSAINKAFADSSKGVLRALASR
ncbi:MAG TPA: NUDIX domain-containing protein [Steroidobacteraceae bacterium]|nr:NUDIX domain-containing protein [Steroidobacteraceae bacterium]